MERRIAGFLVAATLVAASAEARGQEFEALVKNAVRIGDEAALGALFWAQAVDCAQHKSDLSRRQCEGVRAARARAASETIWVARGDRGALRVGDWDAARMAYPLEVRGCLACDAPIDLGGDRRYVVGKGAVSVVGGAVRASELHKALRRFPDEASAKTWRDRVVPRLRTELVFRVPPRVETWSEGAAKGFSVEILAFRVYDACDGTILAAHPVSGKAPAEPAACGTDGDEGATDAAVAAGGRKGPGAAAGSRSASRGQGAGAGADGPKEPPLPQTLSSADVNAAMHRVRSEVDRCFDTYGVPGLAKVTLEIGGDGLVKNATLAGEFQDTPTGECILKAVKKAEFARFKASSMTIRDYPFILR